MAGKANQRIEEGGEANYTQQHYKDDERTQRGGDDDKQK